MLSRVTKRLGKVKLPAPIRYVLGGMTLALIAAGSAAIGVALAVKIYKAVKE